MTSRAPPASRLVPPSRLPSTMSATKRRHENSLDLESSMDSKKTRTGDTEPPVSNLSKSKSKSMVSMAGRTNVGAKPGLSTVNRSRAPGVPPVSRPGPRREVTSISLNAPRSAPRRETTSMALNDRTNKSVVTRKVPGTKEGTSKAGKRPAWDLKGKVEDMEKMFEMSTRRLEALEAEKQELQTDVEVKHEVVVKSSEEIRSLHKKIEDSDEMLNILKKSLSDKEEEFSKETLKLKRQLEEEEFNKSSLIRKLKVLEDELASKQTEILGLKTSVAELSSSRAALEATLSGTKHELEASRAKILTLTQESDAKTQALAETMKIQEEQSIKLRAEETERRRLHNIIQELKGNIRVFCRMRPLLGLEKEGGDDIRHITIQDEKNLELTKTKDNNASSIAGGLNKDMKYDFEFDRVFGPSSSQSDVFDELSQLVQSALDGYNVCVFAYGQTGSGKTFTMEGGEDVEADEELAGMIPRTIRQIFQTQERLKEKKWRYKLQASFLEIYNEEIRDLLAVEKDLKYDIKMTDSKGSDLHVSNLRIEEVTSEAQIANLLKRAGKTRAQAKTLCNERSSRSHSVFMLRIEGYNESTAETCCGTLNLVDLAGSERIKDSGSEGMRLTEAQAINKSLSNLGNVIMALAQKTSHIPYRNSKLTHLLQNSLGGNSKTLMFVNINPKEECFSETLNSLRFATKVNQCNIGTAQKKTK